MNLLIAHKHFFRGGGTSTYLYGLLEALSAMGHRPAVLTVGYRRTDTAGYPTHLVSPPAGADAAFHREIKRTPLNLLRMLGRAVYSVEARAKTLDATDQHGIDLAYVHNIYNYLSPSVVAACRARGVPVVMRVADYNLVCASFGMFRDGHTCYECVVAGPKQALRYRCVKGSLAATSARVLSMYVHRLLRIYRGVDLFITPSQFMREMLLFAGFPAERVVHLRSFFDGNSRFPTPARNGKPPYQLYFGRLSPEKGLEVVLRAHKRADTGLELVLAGDNRDGYREQLTALVAQERIPGVKFAGLLNAQQLHETIADAEFVVAPALCFDNAPMSVLEAFACAKPVLGARIGGIPEQIDDSVGALFEPGNVADLAAKMRWMAGHPEELERKGAAARHRLDERYSRQGHCAELVSRFESAIAARRPGGNGR